MRRWACRFGKGRMSAWGYSSTQKQDGSLRQGLQTPTEDSARPTRGTGQGQTLPGTHPASGPAGNKGRWKAGWPRGAGQTTSANLEVQFTGC